MTKNVIAVEISDHIWEVEKLFKIHQLRHAPVSDQGKVVGMISVMDLRRNLMDDPQNYQENPNAFRANTVMSPEPITLQQTQSIEEAAKVFVENDFHALPVLNGFDLVGIISTTDVIKYLLEELE
jgi:CBS domain-containing protein